MKPKFKAGDVLYDPFCNDIELVVATGVISLEGEYKYIIQDKETHYYSISEKLVKSYTLSIIKIGTLEGKC